MSEEELYKLALSDISSYSLLNEIFAIRDKRFPNEENDYTIKVYGSISLDVLNKYVKIVQENLQLKEEIKELELHVGLRQKRNLISKFDKEYDLEDKKKNPNRDYVCIMPDAEEVYKRYYDYKERIQKAIEYIKENKEKFIPCYGDSCDYDIEVYLDNDDIDKLLDIVNKALGGNDE